MSDNPDDDTAEENKEDEKKEGEEKTKEGEEGEEAEEKKEKEESEESAEDGGERKKGGKGKLIAIIAAALVVVLGAGGGAAYFFGLFEKTGGTRTAVIELGAPVIHELPMIRADLKTGKCRSPLLRTVFAVQLGSNDLPRLQTMGLLIEDAIRTHLRDQERQDLVGRAGTEKLRADITRIINNLIAPARIHALIFKEFLVQ